MKNFKKKLFSKAGLTLGTIALVVAGAAAFSAFEAHIINVTARIENALDVDVQALDFGTVFPQEKLDQEFDIQLSESFLAQAGTGNENLVLNGSFEVPEVTNGSGWQLFPSEVGGLVWTVEWVDPEAGAPTPALQEHQEGVNGWAAKDGDQYAELDSDYGHSSNEQALVKISQDIPTTAGKQYQLSFWFSPRPGTPESDNEMDVLWDGSPVATVSASGIGNTTTEWTKYTYMVTASDSSSTLMFEGAGTNNTLGVFLDDVRLYERGRVSEVDYIVRQKPKCMLKSEIDPTPELPQFGVVTHTEEGEFECADTENYDMLPLLCPYLSKAELTDEDPENDQQPLPAFHGDPLVWNLNEAQIWDRQGKLVAGSDELDTWLIDLKVPAFRGFAAQDWETFVEDAWTEYDQTFQGNASDYLLDPELEHELFGCDLWVEVTGIGI